MSDLGDELDSELTWAFSRKLCGGLKYAAYKAGDAGSGLADTDKLWVWTSLSF